MSYRDNRNRTHERGIRKADRKCLDCWTALMKMHMSSPDNLTTESEKKPEKRRSFLPAPKSYTSKLPTYEDLQPKSKLPYYESPPPQKPLTSSLSYNEFKTPKTQPVAIPKPSPYQTSTPETSLTDPYEFFVGDRVRIGGIKTGTLLYFGPIHVAPGTWCGIALEEPDGTHDGLVNDVRYFTCRKKHGIFAPVEKVSHVDIKKTQVSQIIEPPPKVSEFRNKPRVYSERLKDDLYPSPSSELVEKVERYKDSIYSSRSSEFVQKEERLRDNVYPSRSAEYIDKEEEDAIPGLDEYGIIRDDEDEIEIEEKCRPRRKLPKPPKSSHGVSRLHYLRHDNTNTDSVGDNLIDEAAEKLKYIAGDIYNTVDEIDDIIRPFEMQEEKFESPEPQHSAGGSSGAGSDSWSLDSKDVLEMCNGSGKEYFNITFDGESESKTSTQEPSEESPSPEFIFDQEMIEDGEFSTQPMNISRDSSLGLLTSMTLEKHDLLFDMMENDEDRDRMASQETLEAMSVENMHTPEKLDTMSQSLDFEDVTSSTPYGVPENRSVHAKNLNSTFTKSVDSSLDGDKCLNSTFTLDKSSHVENSANVTYNKKDVHNITQDIIKPGNSGKGPMIDSGISMKGSMSESGIIAKSAMGDSALLAKSSLTDSPLRHSMVDSGISNSCRNSMIDSGISGRTINVYNVQSGNSSETIQKDVKHRDLIDGSSLDDQKLMSDLKHGHERRERPISFLSTTSADTGYVPDTDSEHGTLTLNSPQEWMEKNYHGNLERLPEMTGGQHSLIEDFQDTKKLGQGHIESDSDLGIMTGDTDNEGPEVVMPVQPGEATLSGVEMETAESEDEITQIEDTKTLNTTTTRDDIMSNTYTVETETGGLNSTFDIPDCEAKTQNETQDIVDGSEVPIVTVVIEDKDENEEKEKDDNESRGSKEENEKNNEKTGKTKTPKKKKFNVVKDFKKPNTTNVVSKLSEYLKAPLPVKQPKDDKNNTEEAKNKRNSLKGKIDLKGSKLESKVNEEKKHEEKKEKEIIEKEPVKKVKRTPPKSKWDSIMSQIDDKKDEEKAKPKAEVKSKLAEILKAAPVTLPKKEAAPKPKNKWDAIMSQIDNKKDEEKNKPKTEVKSKLAELLKATPAPPPKKEVEQKPKRKLTTAIPDYSKVQSKLKYSAPPPKPKTDESPNRSKTESPNRLRKDSTSARKSDSPSRKSDSSSVAKGESLAKQKDKSASRDDLDSVKESKDTELDDNANVPVDSVKRPEIRDGVLHIDLAEALERRGSGVGTGSGVSSVQSSRTDLSTTEADDEGCFKVPDKRAPVTRAVSQPSERERKDSVRSVSEMSENGSQVTGKEGEEKVRRKSLLIPPTNSPGGGAKIVKPVMRRQVSAPGVSSNDHMTKPSVITNQAPTNSPTRRGRERNQNRNKTNKPKNKVKKEEPVPAEIHSKEVQRLEALCEERTKQLKMVQLHLHDSNTAFDGMSTVVNYLANDLDGFSCPRLEEENKSLNDQLLEEKTKTATLEKKRSNLEELIKELKEQHKEYINKLEAEQEQSMNDTTQKLTNEKTEAVHQVEEKCATEMVNLKKSQEAQLYHLKHLQQQTVDKLNLSHQEEIRGLQRKQEHQMEELHKQHQDKLEDITQRFDSIKLTLSQKVECLKSECDQLRDRARLCEDALQRDSDYKVQLAIAPYKNLPQEIESLKTVLEMRNDEILKLRTQNTQLLRKLEELPVAQEKIIALQQKRENLEAIISLKTDHEKTLHERCQSLMKKYDKESRANKRLSMDYEELMWKLSESFSEVSELGSQEALFYQKLGVTSPTARDSPEFARRLRSPSSSDGSPAKSQAYRRSTSSSGEEDKRMKRKSGTYLLDKNRADSPLTRSWSPATLSSSPNNSSRFENQYRMTQSWCEADTFESPDSEADQVTMRPKSGRRKRTISEQEAKRRHGSDQDFSIEISVSPRLSKEQLNLNDSGNSDNLNGTTADQEAKDPARLSGRETVTLSDNENVFIETTSPDKTPQNGEAVTSEISENQSVHNADSATLETQTVSCPPCMIPTRQTADSARSPERQSKSKIPATRSAKESVV